MYMYIYIYTYMYIYIRRAAGPGRVRSHALCLRSFSSLLALAKSLRGGPDPPRISLLVAPGPPRGRPGATS